MLADAKREAAAAADGGKRGGQKEGGEEAEKTAVDAGAVATAAAQEKKAKKKNNKKKKGLAWNKKAANLWVYVKGEKERERERVRNRVEDRDIVGARSRARNLYVSILFFCTVWGPLWDLRGQRLRALDPQNGEKTNQL